ncbi:hypothetical protein BG006_005218 [Podila minutissima]|uniref:Endoplasmic reticulum junction formation protein lunapark n=1 Tax=Podila minutissima TaxID=64525 RepID=A0A9P5SK90_9FUNG|nr:hypothetical protein BG006_005218 [Podila minutissima]
MGAIISRLRQNNDSDYEKILSDLDNNIRKAEIRLSAITLREKRLLSLWLLYSVLAWFGYIGVFGLYLHDELYDDTQSWALAFSVIVLGLPVIFTGQAVISRWYKRKKSNEESELSILRADQRLKVEELKKKTAYYSTKTLLERYDPSSQRPGRPMSVGQDGKPLNMPQPGQRPQQGQPMGDSGLRHRGAVAVGPGPMPGQGQNQGQGPMGSSLPHGPGASPRGPQLIVPQNQNQNHYYQQQHPPQPTERHWYDKIVDVIVGDEGPESKYALICSKCFVHNGLVLPQEIDDIQFVCKNCNFLNPSKKKIRLGMASNRISTSSTRSGFTEPDSSMLQPHHLPLPRSRDPSPTPSFTRLSRTPEREFLSESNGEIKEYKDDEDMELISNWHDSDAVDSDEAKGYIVDSEDSKSSTDESRKRV